MGFRAILEKLNKKLSGAFAFIRETMKKRNAKIIAVLSVIAILLASTAAIVSASTSGVVYVDGKAVCKVGSKAEFNKAIAILEKLHVENNVSDRTNKKITCTFTLSSVKRVDADDCAELLYKECLSDYVRAYCISMKGIEIGFCATYAEAEQVAEHFRQYIINSILDKDSTVDSVKLTADFEIISKVCRADRVTGAEKLCHTVLNADGKDNFGFADKLITGGALDFLYVDKNAGSGANKGETELPELDFSFNLDELNSSIEYKTCVIETYSEDIPFETIVVETDELQIGESKIKVQGENGLAENVYEIAYIDGVEVSRTLVFSKVICEPIACVQLVGTNKLPTAVPTGTFMWPVQEWFVITSEFGVNRDGLDSEGSYHQALDIATRRGTPIYAADGGVVTYAQENGNYGLLVKITHENGVETRYSHLDRIDVKVGDKVYKGQQVGTMGITGRVTGPHLHFEIRINGRPVSPRKYLPTKMPWQ